MQCSALRIHAECLELHCMICLDEAQKTGSWGHGNQDFLRVSLQGGCRPYISSLHCRGEMSSYHYNEARKTGNWGHGSQDIIRIFPRFQPFIAISNHSQPFPAMSIYSNSNYSKPFAAIFGHVQPCQAIPAISNCFQHSNKQNMLYFFIIYSIKQNISACVRSSQSRVKKVA